jgi:hypothetical protein
VYVEHVELKKRTWQLLAIGWRLHFRAASAHLGHHRRGPAAACRYVGISKPRPCFCVSSEPCLAQPMFAGATHIDTSRCCNKPAV